MQRFLVCMVKNKSINKKYPTKKLHILQQRFHRYQSQNVSLSDQQTKDPINGHIRQMKASKQHTEEAAANKWLLQITNDNKCASLSSTDSIMLCDLPSCPCTPTNVQAGMLDSSSSSSISICFSYSKHCYVGLFPLCASQ